MVIEPTGGSASAASGRATSADSAKSATSRLLCGADQHRPLDALPQLPDVARPRLRLEPAGRGGGDRQRLALVDLRRPLQEPRAEDGDVVGTLAERRQVNRHQVDAVEQIFAELAARDHGGQRPVGRRDDAHVDFTALARAEHLEGAVLQHAQHLDLRRRIEIADLVEEDRAAVRHLEAALAVDAGVGERAAHVAEHLALEQRRRHAAEVHLDERLADAPAVAVDGLGDQLLAGAALAGDQDRGVGRRDAADQLEDAQHARIAPDQIAEVVARVELVARQRRLGGLCPRPHQAERRLHGLHHLLVGPRLGDEVGRAGLHAFDRQPDRSPRRDQDHRDRRHRLSDLAQQRQPFFAGGAAREVHVLDDQLTRLLPQHPERFFRGPDRQRLQPGLLQQQRQRAVTERSSSTRRIMG